MFSCLRYFIFVARQSKDSTPVLAVESLEQRCLLSANIKLDPTSGVVSIWGSSSADQAFVDDVDRSTLHISLNLTEIERFPLALVQRVDFLGYAGDDLFLNRTLVPSNAVGGDGNDQLFGGYGVDRLVGDAGHDEIDGRGGSDLIYGGLGNDWISGGSGSDHLFGDDGNDVLFGGTGHDSLHGHAGNDTMRGESGLDTIRGYAGDDLMYGGDHDDVLSGDEGIDTLNGELGNDILYGGDHNDILDGGAGDDKIRGESGADRLIGSAGNDWIWGGDGSDEMFGLDGADVLIGGADADLIRGGQGNDNLRGDAGNDRLMGERDADKLFGGEGDDSLYGGAASVGDWLCGDRGRDRFLMEGADVIADWSTVDAKLIFFRGNVNWTPAEIEVLDQGFQRLYELTNNNVLLRDSLDPTGIKLVKYSALTGGSLSINRLQTRTVNGRSTYTRVIEVRDWNEYDPSYCEYLISTMVHELGHNWDSTNEIGAVVSGLSGVWTSFLKLSGWTSSQPANGALYNRSTDGRWWYLKTAEFARPYGRANPFEDWSTVWEQYAFRLNEPVGRNLQAKLATVRSLFAGLAKLA